MNSQKADLQNSEEFAIKEVNITNSDDILIANAETSNTTAGQFAFYVFRNEERIYTQWYSESPVLRYDTKAEPGLYRVFSFLKYPDGKTVTKYSKPIFLNPRSYSLAFPRKPLPEDRAMLFNGPHWKFRAVYFSSEEQRLFIMTTAAVDRKKMTSPSFNRWTWAGAGKFPGHVLCIADPTLELGDAMNLAWYLGTAQHDATDELCIFIRRFAEALGIPEDKIVFWGSSGGGFAALALASRIDGSIAVAINAQTDVLAYELDRVVKMVKDLCFEGHNEAEIRLTHHYRLNMVRAWEGNRKSRAILVQNKLDTHHYKYHFQPYWTALGGNPEGGWSTDGRHFAWIYEDARGHGSETEQMIAEILRLIDGVETASPETPTARQSLAQ